jgi:hypothetical protein
MDTDQASSLTQKGPASVEKLLQILTENKINQMFSLSTMYNTEN